jgi:hypothetical protein
MGTSIRPLLRMLPVRAKILVPLLFSVPMLAYAVCPFTDDVGNVGKGFHVINQGGQSYSPFCAG